jgi:hypothetical protein
MRGLLGTKRLSGYTRGCIHALHSSCCGYCNVAGFGGQTRSHVSVGSVCIRSHVQDADIYFRTSEVEDTGQNTRPNDFRLRTLQDTVHGHIPLLCTSRPQCNPTRHCTSTPITTTSANAKINMDITSVLACTFHCPPHEHQDTLSTVPPSPALASVHISRHQTRAPWTCRKRVPLRQPCTCTASPICFVIVQSQRLAYLILLVWLDVPSLLGPLRSVQSSLIRGN